MAFTYTYNGNTYNGSGNTEDKKKTGGFSYTYNGQTHQSEPVPGGNTPPPGYTTGATIVNALSGITGRTAEPYKPKPANAQPTRQESRANDLDERFTQEPVKTPTPPTPPKPIVGGGGFDDFSNSAAALANAAPLAAARGRGEPVTNIYEQRQQTQQAQNRYDELSRQIQEYDLALGMAYTPEDQADIIEKRKPLIEQRDQLVQANPDIVNHERAQGAALRGSIHSGADQAVGGITSFLDNVLGDVAQDVWSMIGLGSYDNPITALNKLIQKETKQNQEYFGAQVQGDKTAESIYKYGTTTVAAIPAAVMAYATAGGSMATTAGLQTTAYLNTLSGAEQTLFQVGNAVKTMMANPSWQFSFVQESGNAYQNALDSGMSEADASVYSMLYGYLSATVEVGGTSEVAGGLETFAKEVQNPKGGVVNGLLGYAKNIVGEIGEENVQGMLERGLQSFFGQDTAVFSNDPTQNAIIQPQTMGEEAKGAAVVSALLGLPGTAIRSSNIEAQQNVEPVETQSVDDALTPDLRASQIVRNELARAAFEERYGVTLPSSNTEAERVVSQILRASQFTPTDINPSAQPAETTQADVNSAAEAQQENTQPDVNYSPAQETVIDILTNPMGVQFSDANRILSDTNLWTAFQSLFPNVDTNQSRSGLKEDIRNVDLSDIASPEEANTQPNIDNANAANYNNINDNTGVDVNGAAESGLGGETGTGVSSGRTNDTLSGSEGRDRAVAPELAGERNVATEQAVQTLAAKRGIVNVGLQDSTDSASYSSALQAAKDADPAHGNYVSFKTAEEIQQIINEGGTVKIAPDGSAGVIIKADGDIVAVFRNQQTGKRGSLPEMLITAIANGGTKLDCYGKGLVNSYAKAGFVPVARVSFDPQIAIQYDGWTQEQIDEYRATEGHDPDVYFMMHNGQSAVESAQNYGDADFWSWADLDALPVYEYDDAAAYRDSVLEQQKNARSEASASTQADTPPTQQPLVKPVDNRPETVRERGGSRTLRTDTARNEALRDFKDKHRDLYRQLKNSQTLSKALDIYETGYDNALVEVQTAIRNAQDGKKLAPEIVPLSKIVCDEMAARGDVEGANRIYSDIAAELTYAGQLGQANAILRDASPIAKADALQKTLAKVAKEANAEMSAERIAEIANEYRAAQTDEARDAIVDNAIKEIANMSPTTLREAFTALRYLNMLGNFKTQGRNLLGNTGMLAVSRAKNRVKALGQMATNAVSMALTGQNAVEQTNTLTTDAKLYKEAVELFTEDKEATLGERKYSDVAEKNRAVSDAKTIFKWNWNGEARNATEQAFRTIADMPMKVLEMYRKATSWAMEAGDAIFTKVTYAQTLADYAKAQGYKSLSDIDQDTLSKMRDYAIQQAQEATFRDTNVVSQFASTFDANWPTLARTVAQGVVPFRKTPANVGVRMFEYSPLEIISTAVDAVKLAKGDSNITLNDVIDDAAKTITGTALAALGYALAKAGLARGKEDDDKLSVFEKNTQSMADYSLVLTDGTTVSMDWLTPESGAFFLGVAAADTFEDGVQSDDFLTLLGATSDVALNMSFLSGIQDALENITSYNGDMDALPQFLLNSYLNYVGQAMTNSLVGQAEQASEKNRQTTFSDPDSAIPTTFQYTIGKASAKTPGWDYNQADYIDAWGRKQDNGNLGGRILESFFSPAYINEDRSTPVDDELKRLYEATGANILPAVASRSTKIDGERLTVEEYELYQTTMGQRSLELVSSVINGKGFSDMSDEDKAEAIAEMYSYAKDEAKRAVQEQRGITVEPTNLERQYEKAEVIRKAAGLSWPEYYQFKEDLSIASGGNTPSMEELVRFLQEGEYKNPHKIYDAYFPTATTSYSDKVEFIRKAEEQEAEAKKAGWESAEQFKQDQQAMAEFKTEQKNEYDTSSMVAISNYIRNADRTDEQKDMLMAGSSNAFSKSYASVREQSDLTPDEVIDLLLAIDNTPTSTATAGNGNIAQAELKAYYREHPEDNDVLSIIFGVVKPGADWDIAKTKK